MEQRRLKAPGGAYLHGVCQRIATFVFSLEKLCGLIDDQVKLGDGVLSSEEVDDLMRSRLEQLNDRRTSWLFARLSVWASRYRRGTRGERSLVE